MESFTTTLPESVAAFLANDVLFRTQFFRGEPVLTHLAACVCTDSSQITEDLLKTLREQLQRTTLCFDDASAETLPFLLAVCASSDDPSETIARLISAYTALSRVFIPSARLVFPACVLARSAVPDTGFPALAAKVFHFFDAVHADHPIITGYEDLGAFAVFACLAVFEQETFARMEAYSTQLNGSIWNSNAMQALSQTLSFATGEISDVIARMELLSGTAKANGLSLRKGKIPIALGVLAYADTVSADEWVARIQWVDERLKKDDGFSPLLLPQKERLLFSCLLCAMDACQHTLQQSPMRNAFAVAILSIASIQSADSVAPAVRE